MKILNENDKKENDFYLPCELKAQRENSSKSSKNQQLKKEIAAGTQYTGTQSSHVETPKLETHQEHFVLVDK